MAYISKNCTEKFNKIAIVFLLNDLNMKIGAKWGR